MRTTCSILSQENSFREHPVAEPQLDPRSQNAVGPEIWKDAARSLAAVEIKLVLCDVFCSLSRQVPVELSCSDPDLFRLLHAVHSDQVRLLWMTPAQCPPGLHTEPGGRPPTLFYRVPCIDDRYRSRPGPIRRPLLVPCKLRHIYATYVSRRRHRTEITVAAERFRKQSDARGFKVLVNPSTVRLF